MEREAPSREGEPCVISIIDVGSSSVRLLVSQVRSDGSMRVIGQDRVMTRLGDGLVAKGKLDKEAMARSVDAIVAMVEKSHRLEATQVLAFATAAVREATNGKDLIDRVRERAGQVVSILDADEEARLAYSAVASAMDVSSNDDVVFDLGGGSLQVVQSRHGTIISNASMKLGAVRMFRAFSGAKGLTSHRQRSLARHADAMLARGLDHGLPKPTLVVGVGGTLTTLLDMAREESGAAGPARRGPGEVSVEAIRRLIEVVGNTPMPVRHEIPGLPADRTDVILPGLIVVERLLAALGVESVTVSPVGIREGLVLRAMREQQSNQATPLGPASIRIMRQFAAACGYETSHSEHVRVLALSIFDQLVGAAISVRGCLNSDPRERLLLEAAAIAHDVGISVEYRAHHKHAYEMIANADLPGWSREDQNLVAVIARYHRRADPTPKHPEFARLNKQDRKLVRRLVAILRVADGLDRTHTQTVRNVTITGGKKRLSLLIDASEDVGDNVRGSKRKAGMFGELFDLSLRYSQPDLAIEKVEAQTLGVSKGGKGDAPARTPRPRRRVARAP